MSQYYKLNDKADPDDIKMIGSLVGMGVLHPTGNDPELTDKRLVDLALFTWIFRKSNKYDDGSTLHVSPGDTEGEAECSGLPPGYYYIIPVDR